MNVRSHLIGGFTLAEVLVASTISAFVALVAVGALKTVSDAAQTVGQTAETNGEISFAARLLAHDLANLYRDADARSMRLVGASQGSEGSPTAFLRFYMVGRAAARVGQPEGDVYEVEYMLADASTPEAVADREPGGSMLLRRLWPNPDIESQPGGTLVPIAEHIDVFQMRFYDGQEWTDEWPEEMESIPQLIEVTLAILGEEGSTPTVETFTVNFPRMAQPSQQTSGAPNGQGTPGQQQNSNGANPASPNGGR